MKPIKTHPIKSASRNKLHLVSEYDDGTMSCTCEKYQYSGYRDPLGDCRHIRKIRMQQSKFGPNNAIYKKMEDVDGHELPNHNGINFKSK